MPNLEDFIKEVLTQKELELLKTINEIDNTEQRHTKLRSFFHSEEIFNKIKPTIDPAWLSYEIFINGKAYEF